MRVLVTTADAARATGVPSRLIMHWFDAKRIPGLQDPETQVRWVDVEDVRRFAANNRPTILAEGRRTVVNRR